MRFFQKNIKKIILFVFLIVFFVFLNIYQSSVRNFFYTFSSPFQRFFWQAGNKVSNFFETIKEINNLKKENEVLKAKNQSLIAENISLGELKKENEVLRTALNLGLEKEFKLIFAQVIGKDISQDFLLINKGKRDGVLKNSPVITEQKNLVGRISEVYESFSRVILISHKDFSFDAKIAGKDILGIVKGRGGLKIFFEKIPQDQEIHLDEVVITSALGGFFPEGFLVGKINKVKKSDIEPFQEIEIIPFFEIKKLDCLFIISNF